MKESIKIKKSQVRLFNIPLKLEKIKDKVEIFIHSIKENGIGFEIFIKFFKEG